MAKSDPELRRMEERVAERISKKQVKANHRETRERRQHLAKKFGKAGARKKFGDDYGA
jgi:hypothetical protein